MDNSGNILAAWSGWNGSIYTIRHRKGLSYWTKEWQVTGYNSFHPAITYYNRGGSLPYGIDILWHTSPDNQIRQVRYNGNGSSDVWLPSYPGTQLIASGGMFANVTHERQNTTVPKQIWTDQTTSPIYSILYNSSYLPKENLLASGEIRRAAIIGDNLSNSGLSIELSQPVIKLSNGESTIIPFKEYDYTAKLDLSLSNVFDYLQTEVLAMPDNAETISFNLEVKSFQPDTLEDGTLNASKQTPFEDIALSIFAKDGTAQNNLASLGNQSLNEKNGIHNFSKTFETSIQTLKSKSVFLIPKVDVKGSFNEKDLQFSLANISIEGSPELPKDLLAEIVAPKEYMLEQNYPNPFNPSTTINFSLPKESKVSLKIYDVLGKLIEQVIENEVKSPGNYQVTFKSNDLPSGVYFYTLTSGDFMQTRKMILTK